MALKDHIHIMPRFGDVLIVIGFIKWSGWEHLRRSIFDRNIRIWSFLFALIGRLISILSELFAYPLRMVFRVRPGKLGAGLFITLISTWNLVLFNNEPTLRGYWNYISGSVKLFYTVLFKNAYEDLDKSEMLASLWQPQSDALTLFFFAFIASVTIQLFGFYVLGWRNANPWSKGVSWIYLGLKNHCKLNSYYFEVLFEPALAVLLGWTVYHSYGDLHFALFIWIGGAALFMQEVMDYLMKMTFEK